MMSEIDNKDENEKKMMEMREEKKRDKERQ